MAAARCLDSSTGFIVWDLRRSISLTLLFLSVIPQSLGASQRQAVTVDQLLVRLAGAEKFGPLPGPPPIALPCNGIRPALWHSRMECAAAPRCNALPK